MTPPLSKAQLKEMVGKLICLVPKPGVQALSCHEYSVCDCTVKQLCEGYLKMQEALEFYADKENYQVGSGAYPKHSNEFGEDIEHNYPAIPGDDSGDIAKEALEKWGLRE